MDEEAQEDLRVNKNLGVYRGALYENFVAEAFVKQGLGLFYYKKENSLPFTGGVGLKSSFDDF